ncbi:MAG TPA: wax ester/triacylglycerol synthase domain-containing protein [Aldersonia sp.]
MEDAADEAAQWGGPASMSAWEGLMWRAEQDHRTRSTGILLEILDSEPDWTRFVNAVEHTTARIPRLRDRVVEPPVPVVQPVWSPDPDFAVEEHLRHVRLPHPGTRQQLLELCDREWDELIDRTRPPWEMILITGLDGGRAAAVAFRFHHSLTDGMGLVQLLRLAHAGDDGAVPATSERRSASSLGLLAGAALSVPGRAIGVARTGLSVSARTLADPGGSLGGATRYLRSLGRMLAAPASADSPILSDRSWGHRLHTLDVPLSGLKAAGAAAGGSVNDAFVAAILGGIRRYHERVGVPAAEHVVVAMPVSLRRENDPLGGNRFAGIRLPAPGSEKDPVARIHAIREFVLEAKEEPAIGFLDQLSPMLTRLPTAAIIELSASMTTSSDLQISNIRGLTDPVSLAGAQVTAMYPLGPRPGVAAMVAMITYGDTCCLGLNVDPQCFPDADALELALREGFDEVLALGQTDRRVQR